MFIFNRNFSCFAFVISKLLINTCAVMVEVVKA
jgi:hypothetical protein